MRARRKLVVAALAVSALDACLAACNWDPSRPFDRESPQVGQAIVALDAGDATAAAQTLEDYLSTGPCEEGNIGAKSELIRRRSDGTFDLGLSLFRIGESFGRRFGEEEMDAGADEQTRAKRKAEIQCAIRLVRAIAEDDAAPSELRARARYLEGNLSFLDAQYEDAVRAYDMALTLAPGQVDAGDPVGRDAAWNRAIALRRIEDKKDAGQDAASDAPQDAPKDAPQDAPKEAGEDAAKDSGEDPSDGGNDGGSDGGGQPDSGGDDGGGDAGPPPQSDGGAEPPPPSNANQDERILDQFENAPTVQQEDAKRHAARRKVRGMEDK